MLRNLHLQITQARQLSYSSTLIAQTYRVNDTGLESLPLYTSDSTSDCITLHSILLSTLLTKLYRSIVYTNTDSIKNYSQ
jgi:hypothetical protein